MTNPSLRKPPPWQYGCLLTATLLLVLLMVSVVLGLRVSTVVVQQRIISNLGPKVVLSEKAKGSPWMRKWFRPELIALFQPFEALSAAREFTDEELQPVGKLTTLEYLDLTHTRITDSGLAHLKRLVNLRKIDLSYTQVTDAGLANFKGLTKLVLLDVRGTNVGRAAVSKFKREHADLKVLGP